MANILENINLDRIGYGVTTNCDCASTQLNLNRDRIVSLNNNPVADAVPVKQTALCVSVAICLPSQKKTDCIDGTRNSKNICVTE